MVSLYKKKNIYIQFFIYVGHTTPYARFVFLYVQRSHVPIQVNLQSMASSFLLFYFLTFLLTCPDRIVRRRNVVIMAHKRNFREF